MKILAFAFLFLFASNHKAVTDKYLSWNDAEKILGQKAKLVENKTEKRDTIIRYTSVYTTNINQTPSNLNYLFEIYKTDAASKKMYNSLIAQNRGLSGHQQIGDIGDQAFFHSDRKNFCLIVVRKERYLIRIKVNKITEKTDIEALKKIAKKLVTSS
ncbi:hypothetical protein ACS5PU_15510 [Pedobacter sp. GSP4]|uniref:hypothetical protein n=1 Tax=Pedobacter sp. GSP4 TaxID=3453716 RepID=UPI003EF021BE